MLAIDLLINHASRRRLVLVANTPPTVATSTARVCVQRPNESARDSGFVSRLVCPAANSPTVRKSPDSTARSGTHRHRTKAINTAGIRRMKKTGGTAGYGAPAAIWMTTPTAATTSAPTVSLSAAESGALWFIVQLPGSARFDAYESVQYIGPHNIRRRDDTASSVVHSRRRT